MGNPTKGHLGRLKPPKIDGGVHDVDTSAFIFFNLDAGCKMKPHMKLTELGVTPRLNHRQIDNTINHFIAGRERANYTVLRFPSFHYE